MSTAQFLELTAISSLNFITWFVVNGDIICLMPDGIDDAEGPSIHIATEKNVLTLQQIDVKKLISRTLATVRKINTDIDSGSSRKILTLG